MSEKFKLCFLLMLILYFFVSTLGSVIYFFHGMFQDNNHTVLISSVIIGINFFMAIVCLAWNGLLEAFRQRQFMAILCAFVFSGFCGCMLFESLKMLSIFSTDIHFTLEAIGLSATTLVLMLLIINCVRPQ